MEDSLLAEISRGLDPGAEDSSEPLSFRAFVDRVRPGYRWYRHCEILADVLQRVADGESRRVMVFMPPRHGKSELVSRLFTAYWLYRFPDQWVGINSYGAELAYTLSRSAREHYQRAGGTLGDAAAAVKHWETGQGGGLWAAGVGGPITGKGWHLGVIDDPVKNYVEAASPVIQARNQDWYGSTFYTREEPDTRTGEPDGALVVIQTRWHDADLSGWLLSLEEADDGEDAENWHVVNFEAIKEDEPAPLPATCTVEPDWREPGEALCPERRPLEKLRQIRRRIGEFFFSALFQQRPRPRDGAMFEAKWFDRVGAGKVPVHLDLVRYWDKAGAAPGKGDWTVGVLMGRCEDSLYWILDVVRGQWPSDERNRVILRTAESDAESWGQVKTYIEQPPGLAKESTDALIRMLAGFPVEADPVHRDKIERAEPFSAQCRAGNVRMLKADWNTPYLAIMTSFPFAAHDDDVDASSGAFNKLAAFQRASWGDDPRGDYWRG